MMMDSQAPNYKARLAYSLREAAQLLDLSVRSLQYLIRSGRVGHVRIGRRVLIRHADIEALLRRGYVKASMPLEADTPIRPNAGVRRSS